MPEISSIGVLTAFAAGLISFLSPCVLPLVPGYISYIAGRSGVEPSAGGAVAVRMPAVGLSLCFVLGFSTVFVLLGATATTLGQLLLAYRYELNIVGGVIIIAFGLFMLGLVRPGWLERDLRIHAALGGGRPVAAYVLGLGFAFGWTRAAVWRIAVEAPSDQVRVMASLMQKLCAFIVVLAITVSMTAGASAWAVSGDMAIAAGAADVSARTGDEGDCPDHSMVGAACYATCSGTLAVLSTSTASHQWADRNFYPSAMGMVGGVTVTESTSMGVSEAPKSTETR